ncbi:MAG: hypothetical protein LH615_13870, partial [Ferruginibacter sp.]|nr:hypothetical protein [Ferruginibacter sp.]
MKILFLPLNIASVPSTTAFALNKVEGINAKCLTNFTHKYQSVNQTVLVLPNRLISRKNPFKWLYAQWKFKKMIKQWIAWADVLHYIWGPAYEDGRDLQWAKKSGKLIFVEWVGSDLRNPDILCRINKYYKAAFNNGYEYQKFESSEYKNVVQRLFSNAGAKPIV